jgi:hypothetical protein
MPLDWQTKKTSATMVRPFDFFLDGEPRGTLGSRIRVTNTHFARSVKRYLREILGGSSLLHNILDATLEIAEEDGPCLFTLLRGCFL